MTTRDLMIGDYVTFKDCQNDDAPTIVKIEGLGYQGRGVVEEALVTIDGDENGFDLVEIDDEFVGIPLTEEILKKNGFRFDGSGQRSMMFISEPHFADGIRFNIYVGLKYKTIEVFAAHPVEKSPNWRKSNKVYLEVCGCYVHELQHAFNLVGINKDFVV